MAQTHATDLPTACRHLLYFSVGLKILIFPCDGTKYRMLLPMLILNSNFDLSVKILRRPLYQKAKLI